MRVAFLTEGGAADVERNSGAGHFMLRALQAAGLDAELVDVGWGRSSVVRTAPRKLLHETLGRKTYIARRARNRAEAYAADARRQLARGRYDAVLGLGSFPIALLDIEQPLLFWADATMPGLIGFYPRFSNLSRRTIRDSLSLEQQALDRVSLAIYSSDWAAQTALSSYRVASGKVEVVPWGANLDQDPSRDRLRAALDGRSREIVRLVFLGTDWERKGGPTALGVVDELNRRGVPARLSIVGRSAEGLGALSDHVEVVGNVSKSGGVEPIAAALLDAHFLILPTLADCSPHAIVEANACAVPCLTTTVGGIPTSVTDGVNGRLFSPDADVDDYCDVIAEIVSDRQGYEALALSARAEYERRLSWSRGAESVISLLESVVRRSPLTPRASEG